MTSKITIEYFGGTHYRWNIKCMFNTVAEALEHLDTLYEFCGHERSGYKWKLLYRSDKTHFNGRDMKFSRLKADLYDLQELENLFSTSSDSVSTISAASYSTSDTFTSSSQDARSTLSTTTYTPSEISFTEQIAEDSLQELISFEESEPLLNEPWESSEGRIDCQARPEGWTPWDFHPLTSEQRSSLLDNPTPSFETKETQTPTSPPVEPYIPWDEATNENLWESVEPQAPFDLEAQNDEWNDYDHVSVSSAKIE